MSPLGHPALASLLLLFGVSRITGNPQNSYYSYPNGRLQQLQSSPTICGTCPPGSQRQSVSGPYCGPCITPSQTCVAGFYLNGGRCHPCPCPDAYGQRRLGTSCYADQYNRVTCNCPGEYAGADCSRCAPGTIRNNQPPYNCFWPNNTNSFAVTCAAGNRCTQPNVPSIVQQPPSTYPICNPGCSVQPQPQPGNCQVQCQTICPPSPPPPPPLVPPQIPPPPCQVCPQPPCVTPPQCPQTPPPQTPCPPCPIPPNPCPNPNPCYNPCQTPCQNNGGRRIDCPDPCPSPCPNPCPIIPPCPTCELTCNCPPPGQECPECSNGNCTIKCPNPCQKCPPPCQKCPDPKKCPDCILACPQCPSCNDTTIVPPGLIIEQCICDPRGTALQIGQECICKVNVHGARCDQCKRGYFGLSSTRPEGCLACFCSGVTDSCSMTPHYRTRVEVTGTSNCTIEITDDKHSVVYSRDSPGFTVSGKEVTFSKVESRRLFWSLPFCVKGNRVTSYGGILSFARRCTGGGSQLGADHEVILVGESGLTVFWTTFEEQKCNGPYSQVEVLLAESAYWSSWSGTEGEQRRRASRGDLMEVLANLQLVLIRATFTTNTQTTSIRNVSLSTVTDKLMQDEVVLNVESCRCPTGYVGLSCESCAPGYYRDTNDISISIFGACKKCPCGQTSEGCHFTNGQVVCQCKSGFTGPLCQDKEVITLSVDPFQIREVEGAEIDFTCSFTTTSRLTLMLRMGLEGNLGPAEVTNSLTRTIAFPTSGTHRVSCEVVEDKGQVRGCVYSVIQIIGKPIARLPPPPSVLAVIPSQTFICVNATEAVSLSCEMHHFGVKAAQMEWRREGSARLVGTGKTLTINNISPADAGTYICSASDGSVTGAGLVAVMVRQMELRMIDQYPINVTSDTEYKIHSRHGGDYPNYLYQGDSPTWNNVTNSNDTTPKIESVPRGHPIATVNPNVITAKPGDTVTIRCNARGQEPLKFYWRSEANDYIPSHIRVSKGALIFRPFRREDAGVYYCISWNHLGQSTARAVVNVNTSESQPPSNNETNEPETVAQTPDYLTVEILPPEITVKAGENVNFICKSNATGVQYQWTRIGERMPNSSEVRQDGLLSLYRVGVSDQGNYSCTTVGPDGERKTVHATLKVMKGGDILIMPSITVKPKSPLRVRTGAVVRLECESSGSPTPTVTWVRNINGVDRKLESSSDNRLVYEIKKMARSDVGKYSCYAANAAGAKSQSLSLLIDDGILCKESEFRCRSGNQCVPRESRCNSSRDCLDGSDEKNCSRAP